MNITLLCTRHTELGKCNSNELYNIIELIKPEIIFEELPTHIYNQCYNENMHDKLLEQKAIKQYLKKQLIQHIPVDTLKIPNSYYIECELKLKQIFQRNIEYMKLLKIQSSFVEQDGFKFLNSNQSSSFFEKIHLLEEKIIKNTNDEKLKYLFKLRTDTDDNRENEILKNIYDYSKNNKYNKALMLSGALHREALIKKINEYNGREELKLSWVFNIS